MCRGRTGEKEKEKVSSKKNLSVSELINQSRLSDFPNNAFRQKKQTVLHHSPALLFPIPNYEPVPNYRNSMKVALNSLRLCFCNEFKRHIKIQRTVTYMYNVHMLKVSSRILVDAVI